MTCAFTVSIAYVFVNTAFNIFIEQQTATLILCILDGPTPAGKTSYMAENPKTLGFYTEQIKN